MKEEHLLMYALVFVLGFVVARMMRGRLVEGDEDPFADMYLQPYDNPDCDQQCGNICDELIEYADSFDARNDEALKKIKNDLENGVEYAKSKCKNRCNTNTAVFANDEVLESKWPNSYDAVYDMDK